MAPVLKQREAWRVSLQQDRSTLSVPCCAPAYDFSSFCSKGRDPELQIMLCAVWRNIYHFLKAFYKSHLLSLKREGWLLSTLQKAALLLNCRTCSTSVGLIPIILQMLSEKASSFNPFNKVWRKWDAFSAEEPLIFHMKSVMRQQVSQLQPKEKVALFHQTADW